MELQKYYDMLYIDFSKSYEKNRKHINRLKLYKGVYYFDETFYMEYCNQNKITVIPHYSLINPGLHSNSFFELNYVYRGSCTNTIDSSDIDLYQGDLCLLNINTIHNLKVHNLNSDIVFNILIPKKVINDIGIRLWGNNHIFDDFFLKLVQLLSEHDDYIILKKYTKNGQYIDFIENIIAEYFEDHNYKDRQIENLIECLMIEFVRCLNYNEIMHDNKEYRLKKMVEYIEMNYHSITIDGLSKYMNYHPKYVSKLLKKHTGNNFSEFLLEIRMKKAQDLLIETDIPIAEIVDNIGYHNRTWFNKLFVSHFGITPSEFRKIYKI